MTRVLVVDDEPQILRALRINLRVRDYDVHVAATGAEALEVAGRYPPDLVILDLGLPDLDGVEVIQGLRGWTKAPIIVLSGRADSLDKVEALDAGADDYVTKPFGVEELLARMRAAVRRTGVPEDLPRIRLGELVVDLAAKRVVRQAPVPAGLDPAGEAPGGEAPAEGIRLTPTEWHLLEVLLRNPGKLLSRNQLLTEVWGPGYADATGNLRLYMAHELVVDLAAKRVVRQASVPAGLDPAGEAPAGEAPVEGIRLTPTEWHLLEVLLRNPGKLLSRNQLLTEVWGPGYADATGNLRLYMAQLRRKLEPDPARPRWLITEHADGMAPARGAAAKPRQAAQPEPAVDRGVGARLRRCHRQPAAVHGPAAAQARAGPGQAALADHRARHGLPLPAGPGPGT